LSSSLSLSFLFIFIYLLLLLFSSSSLLSLIFELSDLILSDWVSFLAYPNLFGIKGFVVVVVIVVECQIEFITNQGFLDSGTKKS
jgi:hypothetical protein